MEAILTMRPLRSIIIERATYLVSRIGESVFSRIEPLDVRSRMVPSMPAVPSPALLTSP